MGTQLPSSSWPPDPPTSLNNATSPSTSAPVNKRSRSPLKRWCPTPPTNAMLMPMLTSNPTTIKAVHVDMSNPTTVEAARIDLKVHLSQQTPRWLPRRCLDWCRIPPLSKPCMSTPNLTTVEAACVNLERSPQTPCWYLRIRATMPRSPNDESGYGAADNEGRRAAGGPDNDNQGQGTSCSPYSFPLPTHLCHRSAWRWLYTVWLVDQDLTSTAPPWPLAPIPYKYCR